MSAPRLVIRWDADAQEWIVWREATRIGAFSKLYEAEHFVTSEPEVIDLDDVAAEVQQ